MTIITWKRAQDGRRTGAGRDTAPNTTVTSLDLGANSHDYLEEGGGRALAEALRLNSTVTSIDLGGNGLGEGGGRTLAESLRVNTTLTSLDLDWNDLGEGGGLVLAEALHVALEHHDSTAAAAKALSEGMFCFCKNK